MVQVNRLKIAASSFTFSQATISFYTMPVWPFVVVSYAVAGEIVICRKCWVKIFSCHPQF